jgi:hypothetical protein
VAVFVIYTVVVTIGCAIGWWGAYKLGVGHGRELQRMDEEAKRLEQVRMNQKLAMDAYLAQAKP